MDPKDQEERALPARDCFLIYDGECRLCMSVKMRLERRGIDQTKTGIRFVAYQSEAAKIALGQRYCLDRPETAFFIQPTGKILEGLDAFSPVLPYLPGGRMALQGLRLGMVRQLAGWGYCLLARHRYRWFGVAQSLR